MRRGRLLGSLAFLVGSFGGAPRPTCAADGPGAAGLVEKEFSAAIQALTPAAVFCVGIGGRSLGSSGVLLTKSGYVLSDGDAGAIDTPGPNGRMQRSYPNDVEIRIPDLKRGTYSSHRAKVVKRISAIDSSLLKIEKPPSAGFPFVVPGTSAGLAVGNFTFVMGTSFGQGDGGSAALTAGIVSALEPAPEGQPGGPIQEIYTSAAVNPGVNGGPVVDADGALVGIVSTWGEANAQNPYQFLGKVFPIDRIRYAYRDLPEVATVFPAPKTGGVRGKNAALLERAILLATRRAAPAVVSLEVTRSETFRMRVPKVSRDSPDFLIRYEGPVSGVCVSKDGVIVTSLYNLASTMPLVHFPQLPNDIEETLGKITKVMAHFADGTSVPAKLVAHDQNLGIVVLKAEWPAGKEAPVLETASSTDAVQPGRVLIGAGNPYGSVRRPEPLTKLGILSRVHADDDEKVWRGCFQTDTGLTDATCGGALVDVRGRLVALATIWDPAQHGRESGIGFGIPWARIEAALPSLLAGNSVVYGRAVLGIGWVADPVVGGLKITQVADKGPAMTAGILVDDVIVAIDGTSVKRVVDAIGLVRTRKPGDRLVLTVRRGAETKEIPVVLGERPAGG